MHCDPFTVDLSDKNTTCYSLHTLTLCSAAPPPAPHTHPLSLHPQIVKISHNKQKARIIGSQFVSWWGEDEVAAVLIYTAVTHRSLLHIEQVCKICCQENHVASERVLGSPLNILQRLLSSTNLWSLSVFSLFIFLPAQSYLSIWLRYGQYRERKKGILIWLSKNNKK